MAKASTQVDAASAAVGLPLLAIHFTLTVGANLTVAALDATSATVVAIGIKVDTSTAAIKGATSTIRLADTLGTNFLRLAHVTASATVLGIGQNIHTRVGAFCLACSTAQLTDTVVADFASFRTTGSATLTTMFRAGLGVDTNFVAVGFTIGTGQHTFAVLALLTVATSVAT